MRASGTGASVALIRVKLRLTWQSGPLASRSSPGMTNGRYAPSLSARRSLQFRSSVRTSSCDPCANLLTSVWSTRKARLSPERLLHTLPDHEGLPDDALSHFAAGADPQAEPPAHIGLVVEFDAVAGEGGRACTLQEATMWTKSLFLFAALVLAMMLSSLALTRAWTVECENSGQGGPGPAGNDGRDVENAVCGQASVIFQSSRMVGFGGSSQAVTLKDWS